MEIKFTKAAELKAKPQPGDKLGFGHIFTDYMLIMPYDEGQGWHDPEIRPKEIEFKTTQMRPSCSTKSLNICSTSLLPALSQSVRPPANPDPRHTALLHVLG